MKKKKTKLKVAQENAETAIKKTNNKIEELGEHTSQLYDTLDELHKLIVDIRGTPYEKLQEYEKLKEIRLNWKQQAEKIERDYENIAAKNASTGVVGVGVGLGLASLGPTAAMGFATTFGVASTGTAISALSGAAATNAALAWLGGGAIVAGGGGMLIGKALLALAGPVGVGIAVAALVGSGIMFWIGKKDKERLEDIFTLISKRDIKSYELANIELDERISRIIDECQQLKDATNRARTFGLDYNSMVEAQQYELGAYKNLMDSSTQLLVNPIIGLQPKYCEIDLQQFASYIEESINKSQEASIISLSNILYKISLDEKDKKLLWKAFKDNKEFLSSVEISKKDFKFSIIETVSAALEYRYDLEENY